MDARQKYQQAIAALLDRCASRASSQFVDLKRLGIRAHVLVEGEGTPILLVHGGGGNASNWAPLIPLLARTHRVYAIDRPGCGLTDAFDYHGVDLLDHANDFMLDALEATGLERAIVVGNSMGGLFASVLASRHPERVDSLILVGSPAGAARQTRLPLRIMATPAINRLFFATMGKPSARQMRRTLRMLLVAQPERVTSEMIEAMWRGAALPHARIAWRTLLENCNGPRGFAEKYLMKSIFPKIKCPTLMIWGDADGYVPNEIAGQLISYLRKGKLQMLSNAGHLVWLDDPQAVHAGIEKFLVGALSIGDSDAS